MDFLDDLFGGISNLFSSAYDTVSSLFGGDASVAGDPTSAVGQSLLSDLDIDNSGSIGDTPISSFQPGIDYSSLAEDSGLFDMPGYGNGFGAQPSAPATQTPTTQPGTKPNPAEVPWYHSLLSPAVLGAAITSGAGYLNNMNNIDIQKQAQAAAAEKEKLNHILELAKLKYQLLGKGAPTGGRRAGGRGAGGGSGGNSSAIDQQASASLSSGYGQLGNALANIYRS